MMQAGFEQSILSFRCIFFYFNNVLLEGIQLHSASVSILLHPFYNSKNLNCIGALSFYYDSKRSIGEVHFTTRRGVLEKSFFLIAILLEWFLKREMKRVKKTGVLLVMDKSEERSEKRVVFVHTAVFERAKNWCVKKFSLSERIFLFTCGF